jgi:hypothetical protein
VTRQFRISWLVILGAAFIGCQSSSEPMATSPEDYVLTVDGMT